MADPRVAYIQERMEQGFQDWNPSPSVSTFLDQAKTKQVFAVFA